jgi:hypothetical protein
MLAGTGNMVENFSHHVPPARGHHSQAVDGEIRTRRADDGGLEATVP